MNTPIGQYRIIYFHHGAEYQARFGDTPWHGHWWPLYSPPETDEMLNHHILDNLENSDFQGFYDVEVEIFPTQEQSK